ncbi:MAG: orotate phosphoribosyltransferase, partial [Paracoccaceae bacterium]
TLASHGITLHHLCTWWDVLAAAKDRKAFDKHTLDEVELFLNAPTQWQDQHKT